MGSPTEGSPTEGSAAQQHKSSHRSKHRSASGAAHPSDARIAADARRERHRLEERRRANFRQLLTLALLAAVIFSAAIYRRRVRLAASPALLPTAAPVR